jgi:hypothetical protein
VPFRAGRKRAEIARRVGIRVKTYDSHLEAAFRSLRYLLSDEADEFTGVDRSRWYDLIDELCERYVIARLRRASGKTGERSKSEGERSNSESDRGKTSGAGAASAASPAKS